MTRKTTILGAALVLLVSPARAQEPVSLMPHTPSSFDEAVFLKGAPIDITVSIVNERARAAEATAKEVWLEEARDLERAGVAASPFHTGRTTAPAVELGETNVAWFEDVELVIEPDGDGRRAVLENVDWTAKRMAPANVEAGPVTLGREPRSITLRLEPEVVQDLPVGIYRVHVSKPGANAGTTTFELREPANEAETAFAAHEAAREAIRQGEFDRAIALCESAAGKLAIDPDIVYNTLGFAYENKGDIETAIAYYERFLATFEESERWCYPKLVRERVFALEQRLEEGN